MLQRISLEKAQDILQKNIYSVKSEEVSLMEAFGRVLAKDIFSPINQPPFNKSPLDGFALIAEDTRGVSKDTPVELKITEEIYAGDFPKKEMLKGSAVRIMTGAPMPKGSNCVIRQEHTLIDGKSVKIFKELNEWDNYCFTGEDFKKGELALEREKLLKSAEIGVLACLGMSRVTVYKKPRVAILSTGEELVDIHDKLSPGKIYNSNLYAIAARIKECGGEPIVLGIAGDNMEMMGKKIKLGIEIADILITTGGVSVGKKDIVKDIMNDLKASILFWRVNIKPGSPVLCSKLCDKLIISLSGNPSAAMTSFELLVTPLMAEIAHRRDLRPKRQRALLQHSFSKNSSVRRFLRAFIIDTPHGKIVELKKTMQTSSKMNSILNSNCLIDVPKGSPPLEKGQYVEVLIPKVML